MKNQLQIIKPFGSYEELIARGVSEGQAETWSKYWLIPLSMIVKADWNYKTENEFLQGKLRESIETQGQTENLHVRQLEEFLFEVGNGNHRIPEFQDLDYSHVMCYNHGFMELEEFQLRVLQTNEIKFKPDEMLLARMMEGINNRITKKKLLDKIPFSDGKLLHIENTAAIKEAALKDSKEAVSLLGDSVQFNNMVTVVCTDEIYELWRHIQNRVAEMTGGKRNSAKAFEYIIAEAMTNEAFKI